MNRINYAKELEKILSGLSHRPRLLLHSCCAPCSSYCLMYLLPYFDITCFYYNPNITDKKEYDMRLSELHRFVAAVNDEHILSDGPLRKLNARPVAVIDGEYDPERFIKAVKKDGLESAPEGGERCGMCFSMRLKRTYEVAATEGFDYFTTTLTISPLKNAQVINSCGYAVRDDEGPLWLPSDFKKNDGYKISIELSRRYGLYRQDYCGCEYSKKKQLI